MADDHVDPSGDTEAFRAFTEKAPEEPSPPSRMLLIVGVVVALVVLGIVLWAAR